MTRFLTGSRAARILASAAVLAFALGPASASAGGRPSSTPGPWFWDLKGGLTAVQGDFGDIVNDGYTLGGGVTYWPSDRPFGLQVDVTWSDYDVRSSAIRAINDAINDVDPDLGRITGGDVGDWSFVLNGIWSPGGASADGFYLTGGVGLSRLEGRIRQDGLVYYPPVCDPWWWWCFPGGVGPGSVVVASENTTEFVWNVGAGYSFNLRNGSLLFVEARYKSIDSSRDATEVVPITFGIRF